MCSTIVHIEIYEDDELVSKTHPKEQICNFALFRFKEGKIYQVQIPTETGGIPFWD